MKNGELIETVPSLSDVKWDDMVSFYLGCSFSFDDKLLKAGIQLDQNQNVCMYQTNIDCIPVPPFATKMIVSLRPVPLHQLEAAVSSTINCGYAHGAPIHIGSPEAIGIEDLVEDEIMGTVPRFKDDVVPVFWACGVTSGYAVKSSSMFFIKNFGIKTGCPI